MKAKIHTGLCIMCEQEGFVEIEATDEQLNELADPNRRHIQHIFPELDVDTREQMISGTHAECWNKMGFDKS